MFMKDQELFKIEGDKEDRAVKYVHYRSWVRVCIREKDICGAIGRFCEDLND